MQIKFKDRSGFYGLSTKTLEIDRHGIRIITINEYRHNFRLIVDKNLKEFMKFDSDIDTEVKELIKF